MSARGRKAFDATIIYVERASHAIPTVNRGSHIVSARVRAARSRGEKKKRLLQHSGKDQNTCSRLAPSRLYAAPRHASTERSEWRNNALRNGSQNSKFKNAAIDW